MTLATDYALGILCAFLAVRMRRRGPAASRESWSNALAACAAAAFLGGSYHGFLPWLDERIAQTVWKATLISIGVGSYSAGVATAQAHLAARWLRIVRAAAGVKLAAYAVAVLLIDAFLLAIVDYSVAFGFVIALHLHAWLRRGDRGGAWVVAAVVVSFLAAGIQALGIAPHPQFNHNDLYHVVQMLGMWLLYRGASESVTQDA